MTAPISQTELAKRRAAVAKDLGKGAAIVLAGPEGNHLEGGWQPSREFAYLTGIEDEPDAVLLLDPTAEDASLREILFLRPLNPELERWDGLRDWIGSELCRQTGFKRIMRTNMLPTLLGKVVRRTKQVACLHAFAPYTAPVSDDLQIYQKVAQRIPNTRIDDATQSIPAKRSIKSAAEVKAIEGAIDATRAGLDRLVANIADGVPERSLRVELETGYGHAGSQGHAFNPIIGSGLAATVLHYKSLHGTCAKGELLLVDTGAKLGGYCADISRTFPVSGKFTKRQRELYDLVLKAQTTAIRMMKPGVKWSDIDAASKDVIRKGGFPDAYPHGLGHHLGMEVHDPQTDGPLKAGMVMTVEPGLYLPDEQIGIRIEDDVLVTPKGTKVLSKGIPKTADEIEAWMKSARKKR